jgi:hypothetical protein
VKTKTDFVDEDLIRFEEAWTDLVEVVKQANKIVTSFNTPLPPSDNESNKSSIFAWITNSQQQQQRQRYDSDEAGEGSTSRQKHSSER